MADHLSRAPACFRLCFQVYQPEPSLFDFLSSRLATDHQARLQQYVADKCLRLDGELVVSDQALAAQQQLELYLPEHLEEEVDTAWQLLWQNDELLAVYKPHRLPVSRTTRNLYHTLISLVRRQTPYADACLLHRLDTETAGIVLLAKDKAADRKWKPQLALLLQGKIYQAWVWGSPSWDNYTCECELAEKEGSAIRSQVYVVDSEQSAHFKKPKASKTDFRVLQRETDRSLVECRLYTGRKHQIRAQLAYLGHPIIGDKIYSHQGKFYLQRLERSLDEADLAILGAGYQQLVASQITLQLEDQSLTLALDQLLKP